MPWRAIATADVLSEFTPPENAALNGIQGVTTSLGKILTDTIREFIGAMSAAGYAVNTDDTAPDQLRRFIIARARWGWLISFPLMKPMQTEARKDAAADAEKALEKIALQKFGSIESPAGTASSAGNWNSENRLILRTHGAPPPSQQFPPQTPAPGYANPNAPVDN